MLRCVERLFKGAYIEQMNDGLYVSCASEFNLPRRSLPVKDALKKSVQVGEMLAAIWRSLKVDLTAP